MGNSNFPVSVSATAMNDDDMILCLMNMVVRQLEI